MANERQDILLNDNEELQITNGDFLLGVTDQQHIQHIFKAEKGQYYQWPLVGLGIINYVNANIDRIELKQEIKIQLKADNYRATTLDIDEKANIIVDAEPLKI